MSGKHIVIHSLSLFDKLHVVVLIIFMKEHLQNNEYFEFKVQGQLT